jgi:hypothetical protein
MDTSSSGYEISSDAFDTDNTGSSYAVDFSASSVTSFGFAASSVTSFSFIPPLLFVALSTLPKAKPPLGGDSSFFEMMRFGFRTFFVISVS